MSTPTPREQGIKIYEAAIAEIRGRAAEQTAQRRAQHARLLDSASHPVLRDLLVAHGPNSGTDPFPLCSTCPEEYTGAEYQRLDWPCPVWEFIAERLDGDTPREAT